MVDCKGILVIEVILRWKKNNSKLNFGYTNLETQDDPFPELHMNKDSSTPTNFNKWIKIKASQRKVSGDYKLQVDFTSEEDLNVNKWFTQTSFSAIIDNPQVRRNLKFLLNEQEKDFGGKIKNLEFKTQVDDDRNELKL